MKKQVLIGLPFCVLGLCSCPLCAVDQVGQVTAILDLILKIVPFLKGLLG